MQNKPFIYSLWDVIIQGSCVSQSTIYEEGGTITGDKTKESVPSKESDKNEDENGDDMLMNVTSLSFSLFFFICMKFTHNPFFNYFYLLQGFLSDIDGFIVPKL
jgi:hypothetical protein